MGRFTEDSKQRVRDATDLVELAGSYTELRRAGNDRMVGLCPLHDERTPSFTVSPGKQLFKCFGCDAGGDVLRLVQLKEGLDFPAALEFLARRAGIELQREDKDPVSRHVARVVRASSCRSIAPLRSTPRICAPPIAEAAQAAEYLASRGINEATREHFVVGFAPAEKDSLLRSATVGRVSTKELSEVGLVSRPRGGGPLQDRFRGRLMFPVCECGVVSSGSVRGSSAPLVARSTSTHLAARSTARANCSTALTTLAPSPRKPASRSSSRATSMRWRCTKPGSSTPSR